MEKDKVAKKVSPTKGCRRHGKAFRVFVGMLFELPCRIVAGESNAMRLNPVRWAIQIECYLFLNAS
jgi:hypothetical protein